MSTDYGKVMQNLVLGETDPESIVQYLQDKLDAALGTN